MNSEMLAVNYINIALATTDYLIPHINSNDKEPSWDGDVEVYKRAGDVHKKSDLILKVPVQIKGHKSDNLEKTKITFPVSYEDMQNYLEIGGTIFIVVYVGENGKDNRIFYAELLPYELKRLIKKHEGKDTKTKNLSMKLLPKDKNDITNIFLNFARNMKKQRAAIYSDEISLESLIHSGKIPELNFGFSYVPQDNLNPVDIILKGNVYLYAKLSHGIELPVKHINQVDMASTTIYANVTTNGKTYYNNYQVIYKKEVIEIKFGKSITHTILRADETKQQLIFSLEGTLSQRIIDEEFIIEALTANQFEVGSTICSLDGISKEEVKDFDLQSRKKHLEGLKEIKAVLDELGVKEDLDCSKFEENDEQNFRILKKGIIEGKAISLNDPNSAVGFFSVGNIKILACAIKKKGENDLFSIYNFNDSKLIFTSKDENGLVCQSSIYVLLKAETILKASNLDFDKMLDSIKRIPFTNLYSGQLISLLLEIIKAYDMSDNKRKELIESGYEIAKWLVETDSFTPKEVSALNYYQVVRRLRGLNKEETEEILKLIENGFDSEELYVGAYLLLDNQAAAKIHFAKMDKELQDSFKTYPIYYFWSDKE